MVKLVVTLREHLMMCGEQLVLLIFFSLIFESKILASQYEGRISAGLFHFFQERSLIIKQLKS